MVQWLCGAVMGRGLAAPAAGLGMHACHVMRQVAMPFTARAAAVWCVYQARYRYRYT